LGITKHLSNQKPQKAKDPVGWGKSIAQWMRNVHRSVRLALKVI
jgi:hypothetical protein